MRQDSPKVWSEPSASFQEVCSISSRSRVHAHRPCPKLEMFCPSVLQLFLRLQQSSDDESRHEFFFFFFFFFFFNWLEIRNQLPLSLTLRIRFDHFIENVVSVYLTVWLSVCLSDYRLKWKLPMNDWNEKMPFLSTVHVLPFLSTIIIGLSCVCRSISILVRKGALPG